MLTNLTKLDTVCRGQRRRLSVTSCLPTPLLSPKLNGYPCWDNSKMAINKIQYDLYTIHSFITSIYIAPLQVGLLRGEAKSSNTNNCIAIISAFTKGRSLMTRHKLVAL